MSTQVSLEHPVSTPVRRLPPGVAKAAARAEKIERWAAIFTVITPFVGTTVAIVWLWNRMIGPLELTLLVVMYSLSAFGIGTGYHRLLTHQSFRTTRWLQYVLAILGSISAQGPPLWWAAIHRRHHQFSDKPGDPHSPNMHGEGAAGLLRGFWHAHTGWLFAHEIADWGRWIPDLLQDRVLLRINQMYFFWIALGLAVPAAIGGLATWSWEGAALGFLWGGVVRMFLVHHSTWCVNSVTHIWGTRPYECRDYSRNNLLVALITFGEGWHNNHHAFPSSAIAGLHWWQIDFNKYLIRSLQALGLVWDVKSPSPAAVRAARKAES